MPTIAYYASAGYVSRDLRAVNLNSLSQITFLDTNRLFYIPVMNELPPEGVDLFATTTSAAFDITDKYFGPGWYLVTTPAPYDNNKSDEEHNIDFLKNYLPGWDLTFPLTHAFFYNTDNYQSFDFVVYIPKLKIVINLSWSVSYPYKVDDNGNVTLFASQLNSEFNHVINSPASPPNGAYLTVLALRVPYTGPEVLKEKGNVISYGLRINGRGGSSVPFRLLSDRYNNSAHEYFQFVTESPDYTGDGPPEPPPEDPYGPDGPSGPGGGGGTLDEASDPIDFPELPSLSASTSGMITLYSPTIPQLQDLARYMWSDDFNLDTFKKLFADPMDVIIGLSILPVQPPIRGSQNIVIGFVDTGVNCNLVANQYVTVDCGSIDIKEFFGSALDYSPYSKFTVYLPYIGTRELKTDDIMKKTISIRYTIDILSGACTAHIKCGESVLYQYSGSCAAVIPVTGQNFIESVTAAIQLASAGIATAATGGWAAPSLVSATATAVSASKPTVQRSGAVSGAAGFLGIQYPYLIWEHPRQSLAVGYNKYVGYPSNITEELDALSGYTEIESIHLERIPATQNELIEIESLLKGGVIF